MTTCSLDAKDKIGAWIDAREDEMIRDLARLVAIESVNGDPGPDKPYGPGPYAAIRAARDILEARGYGVRNFENRVITADMNSREPALGILAHLDIVPAGEGWDTDPFMLIREGGKLYGRGASDDKGPAVAAMYAMFCCGELFPDLTHGMRLLLGSAEEMGCGDIDLYREKNETPPYVFSPDANFPVVNAEKGRYIQSFAANWERSDAQPRIISLRGGDTPNIVPDFAEAMISGISLDDAATFVRKYSDITGAKIEASPDGKNVRITARGASAHASKPQLGQNAQTALIHTLAAMEFCHDAASEYIRRLDILFPHGDHAGLALGIDAEDDIFGELTLNFGVLDLHETGFTAGFDCRSPAVSDSRDLVGEVKRALVAAGIVAAAHSVKKSHRTPEDSAFVQTLLSIYELYTGRAAEKPLALGGVTYAHGIPGGVAFGCEMPGVDNRIHGAGEFIGVEQLMVSAKMFAQAIYEMCR